MNHRLQLGSHHVKHVFGVQQRADGVAEPTCVETEYAAGNVTHVHEQQGIRKHDNIHTSPQGRTIRSGVSPLGLSVLLYHASLRMK